MDKLIDIGVPGSNSKEKKVSSLYNMDDPKLLKEGIEYDNFRRGLFCYYAQNKTFKRLLWMYAMIASVTAGVVSIHNLTEPSFPAYFTSLLDPHQNNDLFIYASAGIQFYMVGLCVLHIGMRYVAFL